MTAIPQPEFPRPTSPEPDFDEHFDLLRSAVVEHADSLDAASDERVATELLWKELGDAYARFEDRRKEAP
jgi:hypothetical protein